MAKSKPADVIDAYRRHQERRFPFTFSDISKALLFFIMLASSVYVLLTGGPKLPTLVALKTNTPTFTPSITPTPSSTATISPTSTEAQNPDNQCDCSSPVIIIVTATIGATDSPMPLPTATETATFAFTPSVTLPPTETFTPTETLTPTASATPTPTQVLYTVRTGDTLSGIALRFGVTVEAIQSLNNLDSTLIYVGQVLQIPRP
jgi:LysM repeat protein